MGRRRRVAMVELAAAWARVGMATGMAVMRRVRAARRMGCRAVVVMAVTTPKVKIDGVQALGATNALYFVP